MSYWENETTPIEVPSGPPVRAWQLPKQAFDRAVPLYHDPRYDRRPKDRRSVSTFWKFVIGAGALLLIGNVIGLLVPDANGIEGNDTGNGSITGPITFGTLSANRPYTEAEVRFVIEPGGPIGQPMAGITVVDGDTYRVEGYIERSPDLRFGSLTLAHADCPTQGVEVTTTPSEVGSLSNNENMSWGQDFGPAPATFVAFFYGCVPQ